MSENIRATKAAGVVGSATFLSRILGYVRDMVVAGFFGAGLYSDAFFVAFLIPNLLRRFFAEGTLTLAFIPVFTKNLEKKGTKEAFELARSAVRFLSVVLVIAALLGIVLSPLIVKGMAFGFTDNPAKYYLTVYLTKIMFPYVFFICLVALCMGILNAMDHFAAPSLAPVLLNISMIAAIYIVSFYTTSKAERIIGLSVGVLVGGILQLAFQIPFLMKKGFYFWQKARFFHPELKNIWVLMLPAVFGSGVYQINAIVMKLLASMLPEGSVSYLYYSDRLVQFPLGIFAISMGTAVLPSLSRQVASGDLNAVKETFSYSLKLVFFIMVPAMVGLIVLREPVVKLLFERGEFDPHATRMTASALMYFAMGIWAIGAVRILVPTFYAMQDSKTPVRMAVFYAAANIVLGLILMRPLGHCGLALAMSISSVFHFFLLLWALRKKMGPLGIWSIIKSICKTVVCSAIMGICIWKISLNVISYENSSFLKLFFGITGSITAGILIYWLLSFILKSQELEYLMVTTGRSGIKSE